MKNYKFLYEVFLQYKVSIFLTTFLLLISSILEGIGLLTLLPLLSLILENNSENLSEINQKLVEIISFVGIEVSLIPLLMTIVVIMVTKTILQFLANIQIGFAQMRIMKNLRIKVLKSSLEASWSYFTGISSGVLLNLISKECISSSKSYHCVCSIIAIFLQLSVYLFTAMIVSSVGTIVVLLASVLMFLVLHNIINKTRLTAKKQTENMNKFSKRLIDLLLIIKPLLAMGNLKRIEPILFREIIELKNNSMRILLLKKTLESSQEIIKISSLAIMLYFVIYKANINFETLLVMTIIFMRGIGVVGMLQKEWQTVSAIEYPYKLVQKTIQDARHNKEKKGGEKSFEFNKSIVLEKISFKYENKDYIFKDLSLKINKGDFISLVGSSGIGKTTLIDIIIGLLSVSKGNVLFDHKNINNINIDSWKEKIGYVPQETMLLNDTLYNNISLEDKNITKRNVTEALKMSGMTDFLKDTPNALDLLVGEGGRKLSGGQKQRISIARAMIRKPKLLILDEATSALDLKTEGEILNTISKFKNKTTIIAITHRSALTKISDFTYTIKNKKIFKI